MYLDEKRALIGFCPIGKFAFSHEKAMESKEKIRKVMEKLDLLYCDIDNVLPDGMVRSQDDVPAVVRHFRNQQIDALFVPHGNFGTEGAVGMIAKELGVPVLLYGPRDEAPLADGVRLTDTLCGLFATSKILGKLNIPFQYIDNCPVEDPEFEKGLLLFARSAAVVKAMKGMRIGQIGGRIDFFWCTIIDEADLLNKFNIQVQPIDLPYFIRDVKKRAAEHWAEYEKELSLYKETLIDTDNLPDTGFIHGLAARDEMKELAKKLDLDGFAIESFPSLCAELGDGGELGMSFVQEEIPIGVETDVLGAVSSVLLGAASANHSPVFMPEWTVRHPENDNAVMLWHGNCPPSLKKPGSAKMKILPSWIMPTDQRTNIAYPIRDGEMTVCRMEGERGEYRLGIGKGHTVDGPMTLEVYAWLEVSDWKKYERKLIVGPYLHHCSCIFDDCAEVLENACRFIPGL